MDSRTAAHVLSEIAGLLELRGENRFKARAYSAAARAVQALDSDDLAPLLRSGALAETPGLGPATVAVLTDLIAHGESRYLEQLRADTPEGLLDLLRVPGLGLAKVHQIHAALGVQTLDDLEAAARDGRLARLPRFGERTAARVLRGIALLRASADQSLFHRALAESQRLLGAVTRHPAVLRAHVAGAVRRRAEVVRAIAIVAACRTEPARVAASFARVPGVRRATGLEPTGTGADTVSIEFTNGVRLDLTCVRADEYAVALFRETGSAEHVAQVERAARARGLTLDATRLRDAAGAVVPVPDESALYAAIGLADVPPELREGRGEVEAAARDRLPRLVEPSDIRGVLHCHTRYSDGTASVAEMAAAARARGWHYLGISDHSQAAFYAGGLTPDDVRRQHDEIDAVNETLDGITVLKGIEADILADGRLDYEPALLDRFDFVIGSVHSRFRMSESAMTARVLAALDDPHLTVLAHPTGRLLLAREPYALDLRAVLEKAAAVGVAVELNADPHRLDLDWRHGQAAKALGVTIAIGPDAHSPPGLDNVAFGVGVARKGWLEAEDVLNARPLEGIRAFARARRAAGN